MKSSIFIVLLLQLVSAKKSIISSDAPSLSPNDMAVSDAPSLTPSDAPSIVPNDQPSTAPSSILLASKEDPKKMDQAPILSDMPSSVPSQYPFYRQMSSDYPSVAPSSSPVVNAEPKMSKVTIQKIMDFAETIQNLKEKITDKIDSAGRVRRRRVYSVAKGENSSSQRYTANDSRKLISSDAPSTVPSDVPSTLPSDAPSSIPSDAPSTLPSDVPSSTPIDAPSAIPNIILC